MPPDWHQLERFYFLFTATFTPEQGNQLSLLGVNMIAFYNHPFMVAMLAKSQWLGGRLFER